MIPGRPVDPGSPAGPLGPGGPICPGGPGMPFAPDKPYSHQINSLNYCQLCHNIQHNYITEITAHYTLIIKQS